MRARIGYAASLGLVVFLVSALLSGPSEQIGWKIADTFFPRGGASDEIRIVGFDLRNREGSATQSSGSALEDYQDPGWLVGLLYEIDRAAPQAVLLVGLDSSKTPFVTERRSIGSAVRALSPVVSLVDVAWHSPEGQPPQALAYRLDELGGAASSVSTPWPPSDLTQDGRVLPLLTEVGPLDPGERIVRSPNDGGSYAPAASLATYMQAAGISGEELSLGDGGIDVAGLTVPVEARAAMRVSYTAELTDTDSPRVINAYDLARSGFQAEELRGRIVVVGVTDPRTADMVPAPGGRGEVPDVLAQANALNTLVTRDWLHRAPVAFTAAIAAILAASVCWLGLGRWWLGVVFAAVAAAAAFVIAGATFDQGAYVDGAHLLVADGVGLFGGLAGRVVAERRRRSAVLGLFSRYVPREVVEQLVDEGRAEEAVRGQRLDVTVLFCDLRGFTETVASMAPTDVRNLADLYYEAASSVVLAHGGTVMQFVGDEVFAVFGAPLPIAGHTAAAVECARAMQRECVPLGRSLTDSGLPPVRYGIGVHRGEVVAADVGSAARRQYAVFGTPVNVAARLCSHAGPGEIVISDDVFAALDPASKEAAADAGRLQLKGIERPVRCYRVTP